MKISTIVRSKYKEKKKTKKVKKIAYIKVPTIIPV